MSRFLLIDLSHLFSRARHAVRGDAFTTGGMALHIIFRSLRAIHRTHKPDHLVFCLDGGSWRYAAYPAYKSRRRADRASLTPSEREEEELVRDTYNSLVEFLTEHTRATVLSERGVEADDFVARWIALHPYDEHIILSGDSDFIQLLAPNVRILVHDGLNQFDVTPDGVSDEQGERRSFSINTGNGKLKIGAPDAFFLPEPEWWRKALFVKIIRGDTGDGIFSACPGVRFHGSSKRIGVNEAWEDRTERGFHWNNFMLQTWSKIVGKDENGVAIHKDVRVIDEYRINESLIDLTCQPETIRDEIDLALARCIEKPPVTMIGVRFMRFCGANSLDTLAKEAPDHSAYLRVPYPAFSEDAA
jgi:hypothetical protein